MTMQMMQKENLGKLVQTHGLSWYPWEGKAYVSSPCRILVVLESHYRTEGNKNNIGKVNFTQQVISEWIDPHSGFRNPSLEKMECLLYGEALEKTRKSFLWNHLAFMNLIQRPMENAQSRPVEQDYQQGWKAFAPVFNILRPTICLFGGVSALKFATGQSGSLRLEGLQDGTEEINGCKIRSSFWVQTNEWKAKSCVVRHPGQRMSVWKWREVLLGQMGEEIHLLKQMMEDDSRRATD